MKRVMRAVLAYLTVCAVVQAATLQLLPAGAIAGPTGSTIGWGFTITNTGNWIEITSANFCSGTSGTYTACGDPGLGTFTDFISAYNDVIVGPSPDSTSVTQGFSASGRTGIGSFHVTAASGETGAAQIVLTYNVFSRSPHDASFNPDTDTVSVDNFLTASASVKVGTVTPPAVPAPPSLVLMMTGGLGLVGQYWLRRRRRT